MKKSFSCLALHKKLMRNHEENVVSCPMPMIWHSHQVFKQTSYQELLSSLFSQSVYHIV